MTISQKLSQHFFGAERLEVLFVQDFESLLGIAEAQNHDVRRSLAFRRVGVHVVNLQVAKNVQEVGKAAHSVFDRACDNVRDGCAEAGLCKNIDSLFRVVHNQADKPEFAGVGECERQEVNPSVCEGAANSLETTRTIRNKYGYLRDFHNVFSLLKV